MMRSAYRRVAGLIVVFVAALAWVVVRPRFGGTPPEFVPPAHEVLVANMGGHSIVGFAIDASSRDCRTRVNQTPARILRGPNTGLRNPVDVAFDDAGGILVVNLGDPPGTAPSVTIYSAAANGDAAPVRTIPQSTVVDGQSVVAVIRPTGIVHRRNPDGLLVSDAGAAAVREFRRDAGADAPSGDIAGFRTGLAQPSGIAMGPVVQDIFVVEPTQDAVLVFNMRGHSGNDVAPVRRISGANTALNHPVRAALDAQANLYVVNRGSPPPASSNAGIAVYAPDANGDTAPFRFIGGSGADGAQLSDPFGIAVDDAGCVYVTGTNSLKVFGAGATGNIAPDEVITSEDLSNAAGAAVR